MCLNKSFCQSSSRKIFILIRVNSMAVLTSERGPTSCFDKPDKDAGNLSRRALLLIVDPNMMPGPSNLMTNGILHLDTRDFLRVLTNCSRSQKYRTLLIEEWTNSPCIKFVTTVFRSTASNTERRLSFFTCKKRTAERNLAFTFVLKHNFAENLMSVAEYPMIVSRKNLFLLLNNCQSDCGMHTIFVSPSEHGILWLDRR